MAKYRKRPPGCSFPVIDFTGIQCPNCGSRSINTTKTKWQTTKVKERWHRCKKCEAAFKSVEEVPAADQRAPEEMPGAQTGGGE